MVRRTIFFVVAVVIIIIIFFFVVVVLCIFHYRDHIQNWFFASGLFSISPLRCLI